MSAKVHKYKLEPAIAIALTAICVFAVLLGIGVSTLWAAHSRLYRKKNNGYNLAIRFGFIA